MKLEMITTRLYIDTRSVRQTFPVSMKNLVIWEDVWKDFQYALDNGYKIIQDSKFGMITHSAHLSLPQVGRVMEDLDNVHHFSEAHIYAAFSREYPSLGMHADPVDVLYIQSVGETLWTIDGQKYPLKEGDAIFVPSGVPHQAESMGTRIGLSINLRKARRENLNEY